MKYHIEFDIDFRRNPYKGKYVVIEGIDGSGKTTQAKRLYEYFIKKKIPVVLTGEPRKRIGDVGKLIHKILKGDVKVPSIAIQYLFSADRAIHHEELIIPSLQQGESIISDRSFWSAIPYGIMDMGKGKYDYNDADILLVAQGILSMYHRFVVPDITFYLKISVPEAMKRLKGKDEGAEIYEKKEKLEKIVEGYEWMVKRFPDEFTVIDGERPVEEVTEEIIRHVSSRM